MLRRLERRNPSLAQEQSGDTERSASHQEQREAQELILSQHQQAPSCCPAVLSQTDAASDTNCCSCCLGSEAFSHWDPWKN